MIRNRACLLLASLLTVAVTGTGSAATLTLPVDADSYIQQSTTTTNFGNSTQLRVKRDDLSTNQRKAYIRFDSSSLTGAVDAASLNLNFIDSAAGTGGTTQNWEFEVYGLNNGDSGEGWIEGNGGTDATPTSPPGELTWTNAPANDTGSGFEFLANATSLGTFDFVGRTANVNFTSPELLDFLNDDTDGQVSFLIARNTDQPDSGNTYVHAIGSSDQTAVAGPTLVVTTVPEPASIALWTLLGLVGVGLARSRIVR